MQTGVGALPILSLITFFIGLILALQSAYELRKFGALNFVASAVAISMTRELGPLITAIVVIGRSGSAFAAEIGTMKVTEEIDALETMAIDPIHFLVTPKSIAMEQTCSAATQPEAMISLRNLRVSYGDREILHGINFDVMHGETMVILGGSGSGKSTLLRTLVGLERPSSGEIWLKGKNIAAISSQEMDEIRK